MWGYGGHSVPRADGCMSPVRLSVQLPPLGFGVTHPACRGRDVLGLWVCLRRARRSSWCCVLVLPWEEMEQPRETSTWFPAVVCACDPEQHVEHPGAAWSHCKPCADVGTRAPKDTLGQGVGREEHASQQQLEGGKNMQVTQTQPHVGPQGRFRLLGGCLATAGTGHGEAAGQASHAAGELPHPRAPRERECWVPGGIHAGRSGRCLRKLQ